MQNCQVKCTINEKLVYGVMLDLRGVYVSVTVRSGTTPSTRHVPFACLDQHGRTWFEDKPRGI
jgi:hypothetical protein